jgi:pimeloyl-ACP methyl ester carboxylesterase
MSTVSVNGVELHYREAGNGPPVLLIHGTGGDADLWGDCFDRLAESNRVIAYDRRGFTRSTGKTGNWHIHGDDAAAVLQRLEAAPATVVGWSGGGLVALDLTVNHPELVSSLVLVESPLHVLKRPVWSMLKVFSKAQALRVLGPRRAVVPFYHWASGYSTGGNAFDNVIPEHDRERMLSNGRAVLREMTRSGGGEHLAAERIAAIECPVTLLLAELSDRAFHASAERLERQLPSMAIVDVSGTSHMIPFEGAEDMVTTVRDAARCATPAPT